MHLILLSLVVKAFARVNIVQGSTKKNDRGLVDQKG